MALVAVEWQLTLTISCGEGDPRAFLKNIPHKVRVIVLRKGQHLTLKMLHFFKEGIVNQYLQSIHYCLTHWGRATHICVGKLTIIGSDNGLSPGRRRAIIWTNAGILLIRTLGTNFSEILGKIHSFSFSKMCLKMSSAKLRLFGLGLNVLKSIPYKADYHVTKRQPFNPCHAEFLKKNMKCK